MPDSCDPIIKTGNGVLIRVRVVPRASKNEISGQIEGAVKIRLQAPPVEGKANKALVCLLAETLDVPRNTVTILSGETGRIKRVAVCGINAEEAKKKLLMRPSATTKGRAMIYQAMSLARQSVECRIAAVLFLELLSNDFGGVAGLFP